MTNYIFTSRREAGNALGERLRKIKHNDPIVIGIPRGGLEVAFEVAEALKAPLGYVSVNGRDGYGDWRIDKHFETLILVDDGLITGKTARKAIEKVRELFQFDHLVLAVPVCSYASYVNMLGYVDDFVTMLAPPECNTLEDWYKEFKHPDTKELHALVEMRVDK